jgi:hypothetical protein
VPDDSAATIDATLCDKGAILVDTVAEAKEWFASVTSA